MQGDSQPVHQEAREIVDHLSEANREIHQSADPTHCESEADTSINQSADPTHYESEADTKRHQSADSTHSPITQTEQSLR